MSKRLIALVSSALLIGGLFVGAPVRVQAVTDTVYVADVATAGAGGSCSAPNYATGVLDDDVAIQDAIDEVLADDTIDGPGTLTTVYLCPSTYHITATLHASAELTIQGANAATTILDGGAELNVDGSWLRNGVSILNGEGGLTVSNLTFTHGHSAEGSGAIGGSGPMHIADAEFTYNSGAYGGAISNGGSVEVIRSTFIENNASNNGGAITASEIVAISSSIFSGNSANFGSAVHSNVSVTSTQSSFTDNEASEGGAIAANDIIVNRSTFTNNSANYGGAIYAFTVTVTNSSFTGNDANTGGAIIATTATITNSNFTENTAVYYGGAIYTGATATITRSRFTRNTAGADGGAIYLQSTGTSSVTRSTFTSNIANGSGGAINFVPAPGSEVFVSSNVFTKNEAPYGGATDQDDGGLLIFQRNVFTANRAVAEDAEGGALWVSYARFSGNRFSRNRSDLYGGAVYASNKVVARAALRSQFTANRARRGQDVYYTRGGGGA
jgi:predicted outer membrane repeat protein